MTRKSVSIPAFVAALWAAQATAQTAGVGGTTTTVTAGSGTTTTGSSSTTVSGNISVLVEAAGGKEYTDRSLKTPINKKACDGGNGTLKVQLSGLPSANDYPYLQVWLQRSTAVPCNSADRNTYITESARCTRLPLNGTDEQLKNYAYYTVEVPLGPVCDSSGDKTIYFLAMTSQDNNDAAMYYAALPIKIDLTPPDAPTNVTGGTGETEIELSWKNPLPNPQYVWTLVDINASVGGEESDGGTGAACSSNVLHAGNSFDPDETPPEGVIVSKSRTVRSEETFNGEDWGTEYAAAAVVAGDLAGNASVLSEITCLHVVKTSGFWDRYRQNGGKAEPGWGCSIGGPGSRRATQAVLPALVILGVWAARRRFRRRAR